MTMSVSLIYLPARTLSLAVCIKSIKMHLFWNLAVMHAYLCYFFVWICVIYVCLCTYMWNNSWFQSLSDDSRHCCGMFTACSNEVFQSFGYIQWPPRDWVLLSPVIAPLSKADPPCVYKREGHELMLWPWRWWWGIWLAIKGTWGRSVKHHF